MSGECQDCPPQDCPLGGNSEVGNPESISHQDCPPQLLCFIWIVCAWYGPCVNAGDMTSVFKHNILKNKVIYAIWWTIWKRTVEKSQTNSTNAMKIWKWRRSKVPKSKTLRLNLSSEIICWANMLESCAFICKRHEELVPQTCNLVRGAIIPRL